MKNCEMKLDGNILTITVDISKEFGISSSGKSIIIGSTEGNVSIINKQKTNICSAHNVSPLLFCGTDHF